MRLEKSVRTLLLIALCSLLVAEGAMPAARAGEDPQTTQARKYYQKAQKAYDLGRWDEAIEGFEAAYSLRSDPNFLYNMAQTYRRKGEAQRALDLFKNFLSKVPNTPMRADIEERIRSLKLQIEQEKEAARRSAEPTGQGMAGTAIAPAAPVAPVAPAQMPATVTQAPANETTAASARANTVRDTASATLTTAPAESTQGNRPLRIAGLTVGGVGLASLVGGVVMGIRTKKLSDEVTSDAKKQPGTYDQGKVDAGNLAATLQWVGYGIGAAAVAGGAVLYWLGLPKAGASATQTSITLLPYASRDGVGSHLVIGF